MVHFSTTLSLFALFLSATVARPLPEDSALGNEVGVSAPNGIPMSDTDELNRNRMVSTSTSDAYPPPTDESKTWTPPAPLPTEYNNNGYDNGYDKSPDYQPSPTYEYGDNSWDSTSSPAYEPSPAYDYGSSTWEVSPTATYESQPSPTYGSGSNSWGGNQYDDCVKQCQASYPALTPPSEPTKTGKTHVVWVAPTQGVLRYVPFAVNASVGDTVKFIWGANNHTVTKGSQLTPCNKTSDAPFASGIQLKDFVYEQVVNDTNPVFFYCAVPNHCTKGMFGIINPPNAIGGTTSVGSMMQPMVAANPDLGKMQTYVDDATKDSDVASNWGTNLDMGAIPDWAQESFMENVMYTRTFLAANADALGDNGEVDASLGGNPPVVPQDITQVALNNSPDYGYGSGSGSGPANPTTTSTVVPSPTSTEVGSTANLSNGSSSVARSGMTVVLAVLAAGFFLL
jgi:plastocyanin